MASGIWRDTVLTIWNVIYKQTKERHRQWGGWIFAATLLCCCFWLLCQAPSSIWPFTSSFYLGPTSHIWVFFNSQGETPSAGWTDWSHTLVKNSLHFLCFQDSLAVKDVCSERIRRDRERRPVVIIFDGFSYSSTEINYSAVACTDAGLMVCAANKSITGLECLGERGKWYKENLERCLTWVF